AEAERLHGTHIATFPHPRCGCGVTASRRVVGTTLVAAVKTLLRLTLVIVVAGLGLCAVGLAVVPQLVQIFNAHDADAKDLPPLPSLAQRSLVFDDAGNQIDIFKAENREPFKLTAVPKPVINAVLAVEDESFYQHKGINAKGLLRALLANVSAGEVTQGG